jgi:flavin-binding protein dodecin
LVRRRLLGGTRFQNSRESPSFDERARLCAKAPSPLAPARYLWRDCRKRSDATDPRPGTTEPGPAKGRAAPRAGEGSAMNDHVYKKIELTGSSEKGIEDAIANAVSRASTTIRNMRWFEVMETRGHIEQGKVAHYQVTIKVGFTLD